MKATTILSLLLLFSPFFGLSQYGATQYFDGADTLKQGSVIIHYDSAGNDTWQVGPPQKNIFDTAATTPNAMMTDTINPYPTGDTSAFYFGIKPLQFGYGILALQWMQKLDMDSAMDGGIIEFSVDTGKTWQNVFNNPFVYNLYGFDPENQQMLQSGEQAFSGTDTAWKDVWLCYDISWLSFSDSLLVRFTFKSDSINNNREGWMIDNLLVHITFVHTVNEFEKDEYMKIFPNPTSGEINIETRKTSGFHIIEKMELVDMNGAVVQRFGFSPTKFSINIGHHPPGKYLLRVTTNKSSESFHIILRED